MTEPVARRPIAAPPSSLLTELHRRRLRLDLALRRMASARASSRSSCSPPAGSSACATATAGARRCASRTPASTCWQRHSRATARRATRTRPWSDASRSPCSAPAASSGMTCRCGSRGRDARRHRAAGRSRSPTSSRFATRAWRTTWSPSSTRSRYVAATCSATCGAPVPRARPIARWPANAGTCSRKASRRRRPDVPDDYGVMVERDGLLDVLRPAPRRPLRLPFATWIALARATPASRWRSRPQGRAGRCRRGRRNATPAGSTDTPRLEVTPNPARRVSNARAREPRAGLEGAGRPHTQPAISR